MKQTTHRLDADAPHGFGGGALDRAQPLSFRLDGRHYGGFAGDTVLSALLAAGVGTAGVLNGAPLALDETLAPLVAPRRSRADPRSWLPMDRAIVRAGDDLAVVAARSGFERWLPQVARLVPRTSLNVRFGDRQSFDPAWSSLLPVETAETGTVVVGGGIAGMSAALSAADAGERVILVEQRPTLGGDARFFGRVGDEAAPEERIADLARRIAERDTIAVLTSSEALSLAGTRVLVHEARRADGDFGGRLTRLVAQRVILATGAAERLPVFPGNRLPFVVGAVAAFNRAERFGVWIGQGALIATPQSFAYRLALLAADAGVRVRRVVDARPAPQSRFIDFAKATGVTLASGRIVSAVAPQRHGRLRVTFSVSVEGATGEAEELETDALIAAGGWQPRIGLWLAAGGQAVWDSGARTLAARGVLEGVRLAGAAAGLTSSAACAASAVWAVDDLLARPAEPVRDRLLDAVYETPAAPTPVATVQSGGAPAYLDSGTSFTLRRPFVERSAMAPTPRQFSPLSVGDVAAAVAVGAIPATVAGIVAEERCLRGSAEIGDTGWRPAGEDIAGEASASAVPAYLAGRFGPNAPVLRLAVGDGRRFEAGCLLFAGSEAASPADAIGVVLGMETDAPVARVLGNRGAVTAAPLLFVRDISGPVPVTLAGPARRAKRQATAA